MTPEQQPAPVLQLAYCDACGTYTFPADAYACRRCSAPRQQLQARPCPAPVRLRNAVTLHVSLHPELPAPCVLGEVELAPGVVEEAVIDVADESALHFGMPLLPVAQRTEAGALRWRFAACAEGGVA